jgi:hypothetical protein
LGLGIAPIKTVSGAHFFQSSNRPKTGEPIRALPFGTASLRKPKKSMAAPDVAA